MRHLPKILIVEHDERARTLMRRALHGEAIVLTEATTGSGALAVLADQSVDVALVALALPDVAGLELVSEMRVLAPNLHLIIVSQRTTKDDQLDGFAAGADDYITKPFGPEDVAARVRVGIRHNGVMDDGRLDLGELVIDLRARQVTVDHHEVALPRLEFDLLAHLALRPGEVCSRQDLLETVWGSSSEYQLKATVTEHVRRLRDRLSRAGARSDWITTVRGTGYRFDRRHRDADEPERFVVAAVAPDGEVALTWRPGHGAVSPLAPDGGESPVERDAASTELAEGVAEIASWPIARDNREHLQAALIGISTAVSDAVVIMAPDLTVRSFNRAAEALYGWSEDEIRGRLVVDVIPWSGSLDAFRDAAEQTRTIGTWRGVVEQRRRDASFVHVRSTATALRASDGKHLGIIMVNRPVGPTGAAEAPSHIQVDDILEALARDEFVPHFQPIVRLEDGAIVGVEALARWERSVGTIIQPMDFLPEAERSGLIVPLGTMILEKACHEAALWREAGSTAYLAANMSARQLGDASTMGLVTNMLTRYDISAEMLWLEVTETSLIEDLDRAELVLGVLADAGVRFSIDDFGTGWASLTYLRRFPVHGIKIDRSFVEGLGTESDDDAIVRSIVQLGSDLSLSVVAEGVETAAQRDSLRSLGCGLAQGYLYSKPVAATEIQHTLAARIRP